MPAQLDPARLVLPLAAAAATAAIASLWGSAAMIAGGIGALVAGFAMVLRDGRGTAEVSSSAAGAGASPRKSDGGIVVLGNTEFAASMRQVPASPRDEAAPKAAVTHETVFIDCEDDLETCAELERQLALPTHRALVAHIRDPALRRAIRDRLEAWKIKPQPILFGIAAVIARDVIHKERLFDQAYWRDQPRLHALIIGFGALGRACMEEAIFAGIAGRLAPPRVTVLDRDPERIAGLLAREMPELAESADVNVLAFDSSTIADFASGPLVAAEDASPLTAIFLCLDDESERIALMGVLAAMQSHRDRALAPVFVLSENRSAASALACPPGRSRDLARRFVVAGGCPAETDVVELVAPRADVTAERLHESYRAAFGGQDATSVPWADLAEAYREANRQAARHLPQKLWTAGLTWFGSSPDMGAVAPEAYATIIEPCAKSSGEDALMRRLARLEHERWCAERRLGGWSYGQNRDELRQLHPNLVSFDDPRFTDSDIAKDIEQIRFLFGAVTVRSPDGASAPVVIGVTGAHGVAGVDLDGALDVLRIHPWRPVVVLSELADRGECTMVDKLVAGFAETGRTFRLLVPERPGTGRFGRRIDPAQTPILASLLARPETVILPIGGAALLGEEWTDPEAPTDSAKAIADYIGRRANAVVVVPPAPCDPPP